MNIFKLLASKRGALRVTAMQATGTALFGTILAVSAWNAANPPQPAKNAPIRNFSQITRGVNTGDGIMINTSGVAWANAEERSRLDGSANNFGLDTEANVSRLNIGGANGVGSGYRFSSSEGLSRDKDASEAPGAAGNTRSGAGSASSRAAAASAQAAARANARGKNGADGNKLQRRSVSGVSGGGSGLSAVASSGTQAGSGRTAGTRGAGSGVSGGAALGMGAASISGAMPEGSMLVARAPQAGNTAGFDRSRGGTARGSRSATGRSLLDIAKTSAKIASRSGTGQNKANEGIVPFMGGSLSGGLSVDGKEGSTETSGSSDFNAPRELQEQNLGNKFKDFDNTEQEKAAHRQRIKATFIALMLASIPAMFAVSALMKTGGFWAKLAAFVLAGVMTAAWGLLIADSWKYNHKYHDSTWGWATLGCGAVMVAGIWLSMFIPGIQDFINNIGAKINSVFGGANIVGASGAVSGIEEAVRTSIDESKALGQYNNNNSNLDLGNK